MLALCQYNALAYFAFYYASIFDAGLLGNCYKQQKICTVLLACAPHTASNKQSGSSMKHSVKCSVVTLYRFATSTK